MNILKNNKTTETPIFNDFDELKKQDADSNNYQKKTYKIWIFVLAFLFLFFAFYGVTNLLIYNKKSIEISFLKDGVIKEYVKKIQLKSFKEEYEAQLVENERITNLINQQRTDFEKKEKQQQKKLNETLAQYRNEKSKLNASNLQYKKEKAGLLSENSKLKKEINDLITQRNFLQEELENQKKLNENNKQNFLAQISALDPDFLNDNKANEIIASYNADDFVGYDISKYDDIDEELLNCLKLVKKEYDDFEYLVEKILKMPQKKSLSSYVKVLRQIVYSIGNKLTNTADNYISQLLIENKNTEEEIKELLSPATAPPTEGAEVLQQEEIGDDINNDNIININSKIN